MVEHTIGATNAIVTLDVPLQGIIWPWLVTINMWAKSIGTGVLFMMFYMLRRYPAESGKLKIILPVISFAFLNIFLLFTLLDLHQPFRMYNIFLHPHWTSPITIGAWMASALVGLVSAMVYAMLIKKDTALFDKLVMPTFILAIPVTLYTATLMAAATARELWQGPTELAQMMLAATLAGSATMIILKQYISEAARKDMLIVLMVSAISMLTIFMGEYIFGPMKTEEVAMTLAYVKGGEYTVMFWMAMVFGFILPAVLSYYALKNKNESFDYLIAVSAIVGLWLAKHVWLMIPQLLPMS